MSSEMSLSNVPLTIIVAATKSNGIGKNGGLPWPMLKKEMAYFARVTKRVPRPRDTGSGPSNASKQPVLDADERRNVVIMGRKTWASIPSKLRPLKDRTNIVISSQSRQQLDVQAEDVIVADSIQAGLQDLEARVKQGGSRPIGRAFVIGGTTIYQAALHLPQTATILLTRIGKEYDCDASFPIDLTEDDRWHRKSQQELQSFVEEEVAPGFMTEGEGSDETQYEFQLFEKV